MTREEWLGKAAGLLYGTTIPEDMRYSVGNPSRPGRGTVRLWDVATDTDGRRQIFISPLLDDETSVLAVLTFAIQRATRERNGERVGLGRWEGIHGRAFTRGRTDYVVNPLPSTVDRITATVSLLPEYPHDSTTQAARRTQTTRMIKLSCPCGYVVRTTRTHIETGLPFCPNMHTLTLS